MQVQLLTVQNALVAGVNTALAARETAAAVQLADLEVSTRAGIELLRAIGTGCNPLDLTGPLRSLAVEYRLSASPAASLSDPEALLAKNGGQIPALLYALHSATSLQEAQMCLGGLTLFDDDPKIAALLLVPGSRFRCPVSWEGRPRGLKEIAIREIWHDPILPDPVAGLAIRLVGTPLPEHVVEKGIGEIFSTLGQKDFRPVLSLFPDSLSANRQQALFDRWSAALADFAADPRSRHMTAKYSLSKKGPGQKSVEDWDWDRLGQYVDIPSKALDVPVSPGELEGIETDLTEVVREFAAEADSERPHLTDSYLRGSFQGSLVIGQNLSSQKLYVNVDVRDMAAFIRTFYDVCETSRIQFHQSKFHSPSLVRDDQGRIGGQDHNAYVIYPGTAEEIPYVLWAIQEAESRSGARLFGYTEDECLKTILFLDGTVRFGLDIRTSPNDDFQSFDQWTWRVMREVLESARTPFERGRDPIREKMAEVLRKVRGRGPRDFLNP